MKCRGMSKRRTFPKPTFYFPVLKEAWHTVGPTKYFGEVSLDYDVLLTRVYSLTSCYLFVNLASSRSSLKVLHICLLIEACTPNPLPSTGLFTYPTILPEHLVSFSCIYKIYLYILMCNLYHNLLCQTMRFSRTGTSSNSR